MLFRGLGILLGLLMILAGGLWTFTALGAYGKAPDNANTLALVGPLVAGLGVALIYVCVRPRR